ncbi:peptidoglycan DD-metalloendopeptidase family protein [Pedobacter ureilyticus]|uniref:Peptidoglycan DD-metalloendopeptidase family protein n=1 Tax=Pedobacter ureilyticus TaxID=1393051 RepID=A0ABW9J781_9SPHI|nr:M23 family metallopeptidase [Pedobacter helvus]
MRYLTYYFIILGSVLQACKSGPFNLLKPVSPHQQYERKLISAGLNQNVMGAQWINKSNSLLQNTAIVKLPYKETGYFAADKIEGASFKFSLQQGQLLTIKLTKQSINNFSIYMDLWEQKENGEFKNIAYADSIGSNLQLEAKRSGDYYLRLQPELLVGGSYTLEVNIGPSLAYPLKTVNRKQIQSFFGVGRDNDTRKHEGIDIFSSFRTPVLAVANGTVTRVNENNLGGKVVWLRPSGKDYTLYYAHLDEQIATTGQEVVVGDTLGLMGNTGNAKTTPPHLHFGVYTSGGAVDPLPFVDPLIPALPKINTDISKLNLTMRTSAKQSSFSENQQLTNPESLAQHTIVRILAASGNQYKIELPNGKFGYISSKSLTEAKSIDTRKIDANNQLLYDYPNPVAGIKATLNIGQTVNVLGNFEDFQLVKTIDGEVGWLAL